MIARITPTRAATLAFLALLLSAAPAEAYVGPGAGFAFVTSFFLLLTTLLLALLALVSWPVRLLIGLVRRKRPTLPRRVKRVVVVGLDGIDPKTVRRLVEAGQLPHFKQLIDQGSMTDLGTACPPLSPVAWSNFATGVDPSRHGMFDFLVRDRRTYGVKLSSTDIRPPRRSLGLGGVQLPLGKPRARLLQRSVPFWQILGRYGVRSSVLRVPITFPPRGFAGTMLSAMCVPDLLGTQGSFAYYTDEEAEAERIGGKVIGVKVEKGRVSTELRGPPHPLRRDGQAMSLPLSVELRPDDKSATIRVGDQQTIARLDDYTDWVTVTFRLLPGIKLRGICRFRLISLKPFRLYVTPINIDPSNPSLAISHPFSFSVFLSKLIGRYATLGFAEDTWALNENVIDKQAFWQQVQLCQQEREQMFFEMLKRVRRGVCICVFDGTDRVQHMYMRDQQGASGPHAGRIDEIYRQMDGMLGRLFQQVDPQDPRTLLLVMSDHGFAPFERGIHLNNWLIEQGYLALEQGHERVGEFLEGVDWSRTRAFAVGLSGIFINQRGREAKGIVSAKEAPALRAEIAAKLAAIVDRQKERRPIAKVFETRKIYAGPYHEDAPDLIVGYNSGYRASWETVRGSCGDDEAVVVDNPRHWSGDHCIDPEQVPGVLIANQPLQAEGASLLDLAPTILEAFGIPKPNHMSGRPLWQRATA